MQEIEREYRKKELSGRNLQEERYPRSRGKHQLLHIRFLKLILQNFIQSDKALNEDLVHLKLMIAKIK